MSFIWVIVIRMNLNCDTFVLVISTVLFYILCFLSDFNNSWLSSVHNIIIITGEFKVSYYIRLMDEKFNRFFKQLLLLGRNSSWDKKRTWKKKRNRMAKTKKESNNNFQLLCREIIDILIYTVSLLSKSKKNQCSQLGLNLLSRPEIDL